MGPFVQLMTLADLPENGGRLVVVDERWIALFRTSEKIFAVDGMCPHAGANLAKGEVCDGVVACPVHLWRFRLEDGRYLDADMPRFNLRTYPVRLEGDAIQVQLAEKPSAIRLI